MNVELAEKVLGFIEKYPERFDMTCWIDIMTAHYGQIANDPKEYYLHSCQTTACIAGWAVLLSEKFEKAQIEEFWRWGTIADMAQQVLELTHKQASSLFYDDIDEVGIRRLKEALLLAKTVGLKDDYIYLEGEEREEIPSDVSASLV